MSLARPSSARQPQGDLPAAAVSEPRIAARATGKQKIRPKIAVLALVSGLLSALLIAPAPARADEYLEVNRLSRNGQLQQALARAEAHLASKPRDPQMRFMRAGILAELDRKDEAEKMLVALTQDFPELPEPYNNLAVLLAARNELEQARAALEMALRNDSAYATAHENLGDVLTQLAARSYAKALQLEPSRQRIAPKLDLLRQLGQKPSQP
jgi:Flp pilus assembly protein TadD